jgi:hypothetical protein
MVFIIREGLIGNVLLAGSCVLFGCVNKDHVENFECVAGSGIMRPYKNVSDALILLEGGNISGVPFKKGYS